MSSLPFLCHRAVANLSPFLTFLPPLYVFLLPENQSFFSRDSLCQVETAHPLFFVLFQSPFEQSSSWLLSPLFHKTCGVIDMRSKLVRAGLKQQRV